MVKIIVRPTIVKTIVKNVFLTAYKLQLVLV